ncbi:NAD(P)/FAD-dependent oxidoreductase [Spirulina sp. CCNP1310]|uniref:NAD(P)/FAD-dependent oxidoreductase n=1 Tax=Spirulina sp. CCNP1310 TaxID=3110249 RepID=UPI002B1EB988|nr:NAD(P)/FAD-dependent oxidoreductase [Spirulina sp. CCNP1310]MEA5421024.1 NAD(P)/FAD-dependent oxidoreductase [Spirulina sp. CCNP1310]
MAPVEIAVIGGGAAGFFGAITAAEANPQARVTLFEAAAEPLAKVRISGGGRCNVTHHCFDPAQLVQHYPRGGRALRGAFSRFQPQDTIRWFGDRHIPLKTEADGRMFPTTDDSATIVDCLIRAAQRAGVVIRNKTPVRHIEPGWRLGLKEGDWRGDAVLIATGSSPLGYRWVETLGHTLIPPVPSLFTFKVSDRRLAGLAGVSVPTAMLQLGTGKTKLQQTGPLLITHWGLSGPAVLKLSAWGARLLHDAGYQMPLMINWCPGENLETVLALLNKTKQEHPKRKLSTACPVPLPKRLWQSLLTASVTDPDQPWATVAKGDLRAIALQLTQGAYSITGKGIFKEEFVTCGGVSLKEIDFKTMASRIHPGLYFAGEVLDIDGITGGFNFQNAWTTGWLAGRAMAG